jgi:predicted RNA binding protein YcfA (HicA-like mRNA interferase family)
LTRREFIRKLEAAGVVLKRSGGGHDIYSNPSSKRSALVPRHTETPDTLCKLIERQLGVGGNS